MEDNKRGRSGDGSGDAIAARSYEPARQKRPTLVARDHVIERLQDAFAHEAFDVDEFERRITVAHQSESQQEIDDLVSDLQAKVPATTMDDVAPARVLIPSRDVKAHARVFTAMGGVERKGPWLVPRKLDVVAILGGARLDFREARLPEGEIEVRIGALMGGVEIIVPPSLAVESNGAAIMGGFEHVDRAPMHAEPGRSLLRISGIAMMGGVNIEMRLPGESSRAARKRRRKERKALTAR